MTTDKAYTKKDLMKILQILEEFRKIYPDMQMQTASIFVTIAITPGITSKELGKRCGIVQSTTSRNVALLSDKLRHDKDGYGLVYAVEDPVERRRKIINLTPYGERIAASLGMLARIET